MEYKTLQNQAYKHINTIIRTILKTHERHIQTLWNSANTYHNLLHTKLGPPLISSCSALPPQPCFLLSGDCILANKSGQASQNIGATHRPLKGTIALYLYTGIKHIYYICMYTYTYIYIQVCVNMYMYIYIYIYTYTYIYMYTLKV